MILNHDKMKTSIADSMEAQFFAEKRLTCLHNYYKAENTFNVFAELKEARFNGNRKSMIIEKTFANLSKF